MNDRFRFRAWHKPTKKMFEVHCFADKEVFENTIDGVGASPTNPANIDDCVLMQSTGLKDKNGNLIYENDIVKITGDIMTIDPIYDDKLYVVTYNDLSFGFDMIGEEKGILFCECWDYEVVGNIHENPELLEDK